MTNVDGHIVLSAEGADDFGPPLHLIILRSIVVFGVTLTATCIGSLLFVSGNAMLGLLVSFTISFCISFGHCIGAIYMLEAVRRDLRSFHRDGELVFIPRKGMFGN